MRIEARQDEDGGRGKTRMEARARIWGKGEDGGKARMGARK